ncbi:hypothetical protein BDR03DRAFT_972112 [Suillus americanus]|nr:hypothetical protein BDR03DRAFT_972112 [Suillus americanus]
MDALWVVVGSYNATKDDLKARLAYIFSASGPINTFRLVVNPDSFGQSVENLYHLFTSCMTALVPWNLRWPAKRTCCL